MYLRLDPVRVPRISEFGIMPLKLCYSASKSQICHSAPKLNFYLLPEFVNAQLGPKIPPKLKNSDLTVLEIDK